MQNFRDGILAAIIAGVYRLFLLSCRRVEIGREHREQARLEGRPRIFAVWHANIFLAVLLAGKEPGGGGAALVSARGWGNLFARVIRRFGHKTIRGSSTRRGAQALRELVRHLRKGRFAALVPDGPRGPAFSVKPGLILAASLSGAVIIPACYEADRQWVSKGWDAQRIPYPFSRIVVSYGTALSIGTNLDEAGLEEARLRVEQAMNENLRRCGEAAGRGGNPG